MSAPVSPMLTAALAYAAYGWQVFPCFPRTKKPATGHGHLDATTDTVVITRWWTDTPAANIAVNCEASGIAVVDIDPRHNGEATLVRCIAELGPLPATLEARTGGKDGGRHLFFKAPAEGELRGSLGQGIDVKHRGYVLLAPSVHPDGGIYEWIVPP